MWLATVQIKFDDHQFLFCPTSQHFSCFHMKQTRQCLIPTLLLRVSICHLTSCFQVVFQILPTDCRWQILNNDMMRYVHRRAIPYKANSLSYDLPPHPPCLIWRDAGPWAISTIISSPHSYTTVMYSHAQCPQDLLTKLHISISTFHHVTDFKSIKEMFHITFLDLIIQMFNINSSWHVLCCVLSPGKIKWFFVSNCQLPYGTWLQCCWID